MKQAFEGEILLCQLNIGAKKWCECTTQSEMHRKPQALALFSAVCNILSDAGPFCFRNLCQQTVRRFAFLIEILADTTRFHCRLLVKCFTEHLKRTTHKKL